MAPTILKDRYVLSDDVRVGGMATVTKAFDVKTNLFRAIKILNQTADSSRTKESFFREYKALTELHHPNIVECIDADVSEDGKYFMVLEWMPHSVDSWIKQKGPMTWESFYETIGRPILSA